MTIAEQRTAVVAEARRWTGQNSAVFASIPFAALQNVVQIGDQRYRTPARAHLDAANSHIAYGPQTLGR